MAEFLITAGAEQDYSEALAWYAERSPRAARGFEREVARLFDVITSDPQRFPRCDEKHCFCLMRHYPYQVIFRETHDRILIVAIAHAKRRPGYWAGR